ncbi:cupin domain-containing protein [Acidobacteria bacterium AB60]|nr:cupin domain-containing protein [Acidobacteria bacterium AB60]
MGVFEGEYHCHIHEDDDEFFFTLEGSFLIDLEDRTAELQAGQGILVPRTVVHRTRALRRAVVLMVENAGVIPPGNWSRIHSAIGLRFPACASQAGTPFSVEWSAAVVNCRYAMRARSSSRSGCPGRWPGPSPSRWRGWNRGRSRECTSGLTPGCYRGR